MRVRLSALGIRSYRQLPCQNHPEWIGLPCQTTPAAQPEDALPNLPVNTITYNIWDETETTTEKVGASERKSTQTYDAAGRLKESAISSTTGRSVPTATDEYSEETGALIKQGAGGKSITSAYNTLGQLTSYTDATGTPATYEYEKEGDDRLTKTNDGKGTQTYEYDKTTGQTTTLKDSGAGTFSATYNTEGQIANETYPNGMKATYAYNPVDQTTALAYTKGSATWYKDETMLSIHGQSLSQTSTLGIESYTYDSIGRVTQAQETPTGKGCTTYLYAYDADSNRVGETKREPGTGGACAAEGGATTAHSYDEADRLTDPGTTYEPLGENTVVPASDAGGHTLESTYYADGAIYSQTQNEQTNTYLLDPTGRTLEATAVKGLNSKTTTSHYAGTGSTPAWTVTEGSWTRNIAGITPGLSATQTNGGEAIIELANLHGDIIGTVPDNSGAESATLTSEPTAFGVPTTASNQKYGWLGSGGLQTEFTASGIAASPEGAYVPQLGIYLAPEGLTGTAAQDPVNEYLADMTLAQPTSYSTSTSPGAIEPLPVNAKIEKEWHEHPAWNQPPVNNLVRHSLTFEFEGEEPGDVAGPAFDREFSIPSAAAIAMGGVMVSTGSDPNALQMILYGIPSWAFKFFEHITQHNVRKVGAALAQAGTESIGTPEPRVTIRITGSVKHGHYNIEIQWLGINYYEP
jgi:hypothetical protein